MNKNVGILLPVGWTEYGDGQIIFFRIMMEIMNQNVYSAKKYIFEFLSVLLIVLVNAASSYNI